MKPTTFLRRNLEYMAETFSGSFIDTVKNGQPKMNGSEVNADLHVHPYIIDARTLFSTLDIMVRHNVDELAITTHGKGRNIEYDFWTVKEIIERNSVAKELKYEDKGIVFNVEYKGEKLSFEGAYEMYVIVPGIEGRVDIVSLMPNKGFEKEVRQGMELKDYIKLNKEYGAIIIGAHPYTIWYPFGPFRCIKFRLASEDDRKRLQDELFPFVDSVDLVATNTFWMTESNRLLQEDYSGKPLANSDAHSVDNYARNEIGRSGNIFEKEGFAEGEIHRRNRKSAIVNNHFRTYYASMPCLKFFRSIVFHKPYKEFP